MSLDQDIGAHFRAALAAADCRREPYRHWLLADALPEATARAITALPFPPAAIDDTGGKRETHNSLRRFFAGGEQRDFPVCADFAAAFAAPATVEALEACCGIDLAGSYLRLEYCQDTGGFWLEPHTDIGAKLFTMLFYLSDAPGAEGWGTDIYDGEMNHLGAAPAPFKSGLIFIPGADTWHGFRRRPIDGIRRSIIVNYVKPEWRSRHELAFPERPIG